MTDFYLARQPICDKTNNVIGYELLHHRNELNPGQIDYGDRSSSQILITALLDIGLTEVVGDKLAFINIPREYFQGEISFPLARKQIVLEVLQDILPETDIMFALRQFTLRNAYPLLLEGFEFEDSSLELLPMANFIKLDVKNSAEDIIKQQLHTLKNFNGPLIANHVDNMQLYYYAKELGFDLFQGFYFCQPCYKTSEIDPSSRKSSELRLLSDLMQPHISYSKLQALVARDVTLTYRILRYINSEKFHLARPVETIQQAISLLGLKPITTWMVILVLARFKHKPEELLTLALIRGKMCETMSKHANLNIDTGFMIGLLSTLDALVDTEMAAVVAELPLNEAAKSALENKSGSLGEILGAIIAYEQADWQSQFIRDSKNSSQLTAVYLDAIHWTHEVKAQLLRPVN